MTELIVALFGLGIVALVVVTWLSHRESTKVEPVTGRRVQPIPRFTDIAGFVMAYRVGRVPVGRIAVLGFWWWVGWHFFAR